MNKIKGKMSEIHPCLKIFHLCEFIMILIFSFSVSFYVSSLNLTSFDYEKVNVALRAKLTEEIKENTIKVKVNWNVIELIRIELHEKISI